MKYAAGKFLFLGRLSSITQFPCLRTHTNFKCMYSFSNCFSISLEVVYIGYVASDLLFKRVSAVSSIKFFLQIRIIEINSRILLSRKFRMKLWNNYILN